MNQFRYRSYYIPAFVLAFIFCGAIVGETVSISLVVSELGSTILSKLYLVNGILLYGLPVFYLSRIDRIDRGVFLCRQLLIISAILALMLLGMTFTTNYQLSFKNVLIFFLYPISYLSKTVLFLTFWTLANDIFPTSEAKKTFPIIAAWGMAGGLAGACAARLLVTVFMTEGIIAIWAASYLAAWYYSEKTRVNFQERLRLREDFPSTGNNLFSGASDVLTLKLVKLMAVLYFLVFIAIFSIDYLFWEVCTRWFRTSEALVSFQFTFYLVHAIVTISGLWFLLPPLINRVGFTKLFYCLPVVLSIGTACLVMTRFFNQGKLFFITFICIQFFRYIIFENAFSPIYQMFFAAIEKEKRGRAKTLLEGIVKPGAIIASGLLIMGLRHSSLLILLLVLVCSVLTVVIVFYLRRTYSMALIPETTLPVEPRRIIASATHYEGQELQEIIKEYAQSPDSDMRIVSVKLLAGLGSFQAFETMVKMYDNEKVPKIREFIARSISDFYWYQTRPFAEKLLDDPNPRVRSNTLLAINVMHCNWKRHLKSKVYHFLFDSHLRVQVEAARYLWENGEAHERETVQAFLGNLLNSQSSDRKSAGIYLTGLIQIRGWQNILIENLATKSLQVFTKSADVILRSASLSTRIKALCIIETLSREHIAITGRIIERIGSSLWETLIEYLPECKSKRMIFEMIRCLRVLADEIRLAGKMWSLKDDASSVIQKWVLTELESVYKDGIIRLQLESTSDEVNYDYLDRALRENHLRICEWAVNALVLLDKRGLLIWNHTDIDIRDNAQRMDLVEILESGSYQKIGVLILPLLKNDSWNTIGKIGKNYFHIDGEQIKNLIEHFLNSDNRWVVLCGLRTILYYSDDFLKKVSIMEILKDLSHDSNRHVALAGRDMLEKKTKEEKLRSEAFILLEKVLFFKKTSLFKNVSAEKLMRLAEISQYAVYEKDTVISVQGEVSDQLYIVKKGNLKVVKSESGSNETVITIIKEGETYGEIGLFSQAPRSASAIASEFCELFIIKRGSFKKLLLEVPEIAYNMLETMSERLRKNGDEMVELKKRSDEDLMIQNLV